MRLDFDTSIEDSLGTLPLNSFRLLYSAPF